MDITDKEREIVKAAIKGHTNEQAAKLLFMSLQAFKWNLKKLQEKCGCSNTKQLIAFFYENNLVERISLKANNTDPNLN